MPRVEFLKIFVKYKKTDFLSFNLLQPIYFHSSQLCDERILENKYRENQDSDYTYYKTNFSLSKKKK